MNIAETVYQHVKTMPPIQAMEVLHFVEFLETKPEFKRQQTAKNELLLFMQNLPVANRNDAEIDAEFFAMRDEWDNA
ncbi:MAG: DUF2281 domain-containing protein [Methylococcaceae bacterium]